MNVFTLCALALCVYMTLWFMIACIIKRNDVADIAWGLGFVLLAWLAFPFADASQRSIIVNVLVTVWGMRLAWHIGRRNMRKSEDARYAAWRTEWTYFYTRSFFQIYVLQGVLLYMIAVPIICIHQSIPIAWGVMDAIALIVWGIGFLFESIGDAQLKTFLADPQNKGHIMDRGLWAYTRHPNYFGEVTQWWGIFLFAVSLPWGFLTIVSPITITVLILFVSGVPMLEKKYAGRADFERYKKETSMFVPLPKKINSVS